MERPMEHRPTILVPLDGSSFGEAILGTVQALARAAEDAEFRLTVLEDGRGARAAYLLADGEWRVLAAAVARLERALARGPDRATARDRGAPDAAGMPG